MDKWLNQFFTEINKEKYNSDIMPKMWQILNEVAEKHKLDEHRILYLGLYGSQNYRMENEGSDIDTECFIFPSKDDIIFGLPFYSCCITTSFGTCHIKDIRAAFNELRKSSPNILEVFASPYAIINKEYEFQLKQICCEYINYFATLNRYKLMRGLDGLYAKYRRDMMTSNKAYANMLRMENMMTNVLLEEPYTKELVPHNYIALRDLKNSLEINEDIRTLTETGYSAVLRANVDRFYEITEPRNYSSVLGEINFWESELMTRYIRLEF